MLPSTATLLYTYSPLPHLTSSSIRLLPQSPLSAALVQVIYNLFIHKFRITFYFLSHLTSQQPYDTTVHAFPEKLSSLTTTHFHSFPPCTLCAFSVFFLVTLSWPISQMLYTGICYRLFFFLHSRYSP